MELIVGPNSRAEILAGPKFGQSGMTMDTLQVDVFFRGDIVPGQNILDVRERLKKLFNADEQQLQKLFSGRPVAIRRNLDREAAEQYREAVFNAGAMVELRPVKTEATSAEVGFSDNKAPIQSKAELQNQSITHDHGREAEEAEDEDVPDFSIAPIGADMLREEDRKVIDPVEVVISALAVEDMSGDILQDSEKKHVDPVEVDISHLSVEDLPPQ